MDYNNYVAQLIAAKELASNRLLRPNFFGNVVGVGIGNKVVDEVPTETICVRIYVQSKFDIDDVTPAYLLPSSFLDIPTDILPVGRLGVERPLQRRLPAVAEPGKKIEYASPEEVPIGPGSPIRLQSNNANLSSRAVGTLGAIVTSKGKTYILSCNHVLNYNGRVNKDSKAEIVSGDLSFGKYAPKIAAPGKLFVPLKRNGSNVVDCALAEVRFVQQVPAPCDALPMLAEGPWKPPKAKLQAQFPAPIKVAESVEPYRDQAVMKFGAVTGLTRGVVVDINADFYIDYGFGTFLFKNQVVIDGQGQHNFEGPFKDIFATDGDSGALLMDQQNQNPVALIFAEAGRFAVACPYREVEKQIGLLLNPPPEEPLRAPKPRVKPEFTIVTEVPVKETVTHPRYKKKKKN
jgi:hypothetical protein